MKMREVLRRWRAVLVLVAVAGGCDPGVGEAGPAPRDAGGAAGGAAKSPPGDGKGDRSGVPGR